MHAYKSSCTICRAVAASVSQPWWKTPRHVPASDEAGGKIPISCWPGQRKWVSSAPNQGSSMTNQQSRHRCVALNSVTVPEPTLALDQDNYLTN